MGYPGGQMLPTSAMMHQMGPDFVGGGQSVFQTNASHVISSPNTFNMLADATTAPYPLDNSMMRSSNQAMSPQGMSFYMIFYLFNTFLFVALLEMQRQQHEFMIQS